MIRFFLLIVGLITSNIEYTNGTLITLSFYFSIIFSSVFLLKFNRKIKLSLYVIFVFLSVFIKELIPFLPLIAYDIYTGYDEGYLLFLTIIPILYNYDKDTVFFVLLFIIISVILKDEIIKHEALKKSYYDFQDTIKYERDTLTKKLNDTNRIIDENTELAVIKERARIARDIHDNLGHTLTRALYQIKMHELNSEVDLSDVKKNINDSIIEIRNSVHNLQNTTLDLNEEIEKIISNEQRIKINYSNNINRNLSHKFNLAIIYTIKECLVNSIKHSNATIFDIQIFEINKEINVLIKDNGSNYKPVNPGIGLLNIENRISSLGGKTRFSTDNGFRVFIKIILEEE